MGGRGWLKRGERGTRACGRAMRMVVHRMNVRQSAERALCDSEVDIGRAAGKHAHAAFKRPGRRAARRLLPDPYKPDAPLPPRRTKGRTSLASSGPGAEPRAAGGMGRSRESNGAMQHGSAVAGRSGRGTKAGPCHPEAGPEGVTRNRVYSTQNQNQQTHHITSEACPCPRRSSAA